MIVYIFKYVFAIKFNLFVRRSTIIASALVVVGAFGLLIILAVKFGWKPKCQRSKNSFTYTKLKKKRYALFLTVVPSSIYLCLPFMIISLNLNTKKPKWVYLVIWFLLSTG